MRFLVVGLLSIGFACCALQTDAGPILDEIVNCMKLDQEAPGSHKNSFDTVSQASPVGQTFATGPRTRKISRIAIGVAYWSDEWQPDESLVMSLYDGPDRSRKLASFAMPYKWRQWEGAVMMFPLNAEVQPNRSYYFEMTVEGGNRTITGIFHSTAPYDRGSAYVAGKPADHDLWFETHVKTDWDRDAAYQEKFDNWNLDFPGLEKVKAAVRTKDWDTACKELVAFYEAGLFKPRPPEPKADADTKAADLACEMKVIDVDGSIVHIGPDWNHYATWPKRGGVGLTRGGIRKELAGAYRHTGNEKYAKCFNDMILCVLRDQPSPVCAGVMKSDERDLTPSLPAGIRGGSMWSALSIGARATQTAYYYSSVASSPNFSLDARVAMIFNVADMINALSMMKGGGNWETQITSTFVEFAQDYPEFKKSKGWFQMGWDGLVKNLMETVRPDGPLGEATFNYHMLTCNRYMSLLETARNLKLPVGQDVEERVKKAIEYIMYSTMPDGDLPAWGDTNPPTNGKALLLRGAKLWDRKDMLWVGSERKDGSPPAETSYQFPESGYFIMRSDWRPDGAYLALHNGLSTSHGHADANSIVLAWDGEVMLVDPGVYVYGTPESAILSSTRSHSTVQVDASDTHQRNGENVWKSTPEFDYLKATNAGYRGADDVRHTREIVFVKPDYWVVRDSVTGSSTRKLDSRFVCMPSKMTVSEDGRRAVARFESGRTLTILTAGKPYSALTVDEGKLATWSDLKPIPVAHFFSEATLPFSAVTVLYPSRGEADISVELRSDQAVVVKNAQTKREDVIRFQANGATIASDRQSGQ